MLKSIYQCEEGNYIHCYTCTSKYIFIVESALSSPYDIFLKFSKIDEVAANVKTLNYPILFNRKTLAVDDSTPRVQSIKIVNVPKFVEGKLIIDNYLVLTSTNGIQICSVDDIIDYQNSNSNTKIHKWDHSRRNDYITSSYSQGYKEDSILVTYGTILGDLVQFKYNIVDGKFSKMILSSTLLSVKENLMDSVTNISGIQLGSNFPGEEDEILWSCQSSSKMMTITSLDDNIFIINEGKMKSLNLDEIETYGLGPDEVPALNWGSFLVTEDENKKLQEYILLNVTNVGSILYQKDETKRWKKLDVFDRDFSQNETSIFDCIICKSDINSDITIISGSENGILYIWEYDPKRSTVNKYKQIKCSNSSVVYQLSVTKEGRLFLVDNDSTCVKSLKLSQISSS
ncbi:hypothetical protein Kpol_541p27 [Vanderwaltozyma polyspora DSM 70294]|uniref:Uncharacterized protein n=1 Tax=Vanderwaltozyma polyspora (strain ATCC 22028 / DSM 70294 / BCRC 21397 / CBS 2163 / NBRC 10782 / NRRL Y-8283 / UCD 57-17) TaxID=436907 RepID=A7TIX2_VANPO|nr:uncharacterized protein Kpol_541p27 [Vanderwaltozyma polyspora DSM 70294]EDO17784.1 hypothetical protein Kpol_541p27 [Vanderwaltozyma polyspora DSM 70294]